MKIISPALSRIARLRNIWIEQFMSRPFEMQEHLFKDLIEQGRETRFGKEHHFDRVHSVQDYKKNVPLHEYEDLKPYIQCILEGEQNVLWNSPIKWFAKSSGTTNERSKFIPVSKESLKECHYRGGRDVLTLYYNNYPDSNLLTGKSLVIGGSHQISPLNDQISIGDLSAIVLQNMPFYGQIMRTPDLTTALMSEWETKMKRITQESITENVSSIVGVPSWTLILIKKILESTGKSTLKEIWPNLELFIHGGVNFAPYAPQFRELIGDPDMRYLETYNASEGFFAAQDNLKTDEGMLLMLRHGIFYEFLPVEEYGKAHSKTLQLHEVEIGKTYGLVISTNAGLWRYILGDTIKFTSTDPFRIIVNGRLKSFINTFGEEVIVENADRAMAKACKKNEAIIRDYTAGPILFSDQANGAHQWLIEFEKAPKDLETFKGDLDKALKEVNSDYASKRHGDMVLLEPIITALPKDSFNKWLKKKGKLGGQHKVPRLNNNRKIIEEILNIIR